MSAELVIKIFLRISCETAERWNNSFIAMNSLLSYVCVWTLVYFMWFFMCEFWKSSFEIHKKIVSEYLTLVRLTFLDKLLCIFAFRAMDSITINIIFHTTSTISIQVFFSFLKCIWLHTKSISLLNSCFAPFVHFIWLSIYKILLVLIWNLVFFSEMWHLRGSSWIFFLYLHNNFYSSERTSKHNLRKNVEAFECLRKNLEKSIQKVVSLVFSQ